MHAVLDFTAARRRLEARAEHSIEIDARAIPVEYEFVPTATMIELLMARMSYTQLAEAMFDELEEAK